MRTIKWLHNFLENFVRDLLAQLHFSFRENGSRKAYLRSIFVAAEVMNYA